MTANNEADKGLAGLPLFTENPRKVILGNAVTQNIPRIRAFRKLRLLQRHVVAGLLAGLQGLIAILGIRRGGSASGATWGVSFVNRGSDVATIRATLRGSFLLLKAEVVADLGLEL